MRDTFEFENSNGMHSNQPGKGNFEDQWYYAGRNNNGKKRISSVKDATGASKEELQRSIAHRSIQYTYAEVVRNKMIRDKTREMPTIFVLNIPHKGTAKEIWKYFGRNNDIRDIILPRKRDINGNRIGFIKMEKRREAEELIYELDNTIFMGHRIHLKFTQSGNKNYQQKAKSENIDRRNEHKETDAGTIKETELVDQPKFRIIKLLVDNIFGEEATRSLVGITETEQWPDILQEKKTLSGLSGITIRGITDSTFIITFLNSAEMHNTDKKILSHWFKEIKKLES